MLDRDKMITSKAKLKEYLECEKKIYNVSTLKYLLQITETAILFKHQVLLRKAEYYTNTGNMIMSRYYRYRLMRIQQKYTLHIPLNCCDKGLKIMHLGPVLMNGRVTVGEHCVFHMNTSLVAGGTNDDAPCLGNGVIVGIGAVILGGVSIADNVAIGANAVVNKNIEECNIAVAGVPAKKISNNGSTEWNKKAKGEPICETGHM